MDRLEELDSIGRKLLVLRRKLAARTGLHAYRDSVPMIEEQIRALELSQAKGREDDLH